MQLNTSPYLQTAPAGTYRLPAGLTSERRAEREALHPLDHRRYLDSDLPVPPLGYAMVREAEATDCLPQSELIAHVDHALKKIKVWAPIPFEAHTPVIIIAGGPSAADNIDLIREKSERGAVIITVNGAHDWLIHEHGIIPWGASFLDPLLNPAIDWVQRPHKDVTYIVGSIIHPEVLDKLDGHKIIGWHPVTGDVVEYLQNTLTEDFMAVGGGSTTALRMLNLVAQGGSKWIEYFGLDSSYQGSYKNGKHHSYDQPIPPGTDRYNEMKIWSAGREFICDSGMAIQAEDFRKLFWQFFPLMTIVVHGDGLIPHIWKEELSHRWKGISQRLPSRAS